MTQPDGTQAAPTVSGSALGVWLGVWLGLLLVACVVGAVILFRVVAVGGSGVAYRGSADRPALPGVGAPPPQGRYEVVYEVTGTGRAHVLYTVTTGYAVAQMRWVTLPWRITMTLDSDAGEVTLRALTDQAPPDNFGCRLVVDAETVTDRTPDESNVVTCQIPPRSGGSPDRVGETARGHLIPRGGSRTGLLDIMYIIESA